MEQSARTLDPVVQKLEQAIPDFQPDTGPDIAAQTIRSAGQFLPAFLGRLPQAAMRMFGMEFGRGREELLEGGADPARATLGAVPSAAVASAGAALEFPFLRGQGGNLAKRALRYPAAGGVEALEEAVQAPAELLGRSVIVTGKL